MTTIIFVGEFTLPVSVAEEMLLLGRPLPLVETTRLRSAARKCQHSESPFAWSGHNRGLNYFQDSRDPFKRIEIKEFKVIMVLGIEKMLKGSNIMWFKSFKMISRQPATWFSNLVD